MRVVRLPPEALPPTPREFQAIEGGLGLIGADLPRQASPGGQMDVVLRWATIGQPDRNYTVFVQARRDGAVRAQQDGQPLGGAAPTTTWRPGDIVIDPHSVALAADLPAGTYTLYAGLYDLATDRRLHLIDAAGRVAPPDEMRLGDVAMVPKG
jgi:hypothetical protein